MGRMQSVASVTCISGTIRRRRSSAAFGLADEGLRRVFIIPPQANAVRKDR